MYAFDVMTAVQGCYVLVHECPTKVTFVPVCRVCGTEDAFYVRLFWAGSIAFSVTPCVFMNPYV